VGIAQLHGRYEYRRRHEYDAETHGRNQG
jgi:hypothetical protein